MKISILYKSVIHFKYKHENGTIQETNMEIKTSFYPYRKEIFDYFNEKYGPIHEFQIDFKEIINGFIYVKEY